MKRNAEHCDQKGETLSRDSMIVSPNFVGTIQMNFQNCDDKGRRNPVVDKDGYQWKKTTNKSRKTVYKCSALQEGIGCSAVKTIVKPLFGKLTINYLAAHSCSTNALVDKEVEVEKAMNQPENEEPNFEEDFADKLIEMDTSTKNSS